MKTTRPSLQRLWETPSEEEDLPPGAAAAWRSGALRVRGLQGPEAVEGEKDAAAV